VDERATITKAQSLSACYIVGTGDRHRADLIALSHTHAQAPLKTPTAKHVLRPAPCAGSSALVNGTEKIALCTPGQPERR
jgi:hypothetical protein